MALPITPSFQADLVVLGNMTINYNPVWDGVSWVVDPNGITLTGFGQLTSQDRNVASANTPLVWADLPAGAQNALQQLYGFVEEALQDRYTTPP